MVRVYHNLKTDFLNAPKVVRFRDLLWVADVHTDDLDEAFRLTNHIDGHWLDNDEVSPAVKEARSTSVGDILVRGGFGRETEVYVVDFVGFQPAVIDYGKREEGHGID